MSPRPGIGFLEGLAGTTNGGIFTPPLWVDLDKKPGYTSQADQVPGWSVAWAKQYLNPIHFVWGTNVVWFAIALGAYTFAPYDLDGPSPRVLSVDLVCERVLVHCAMTFGFFGFWSVCCYGLKATSRRFNNTEGGPSLSRFVHNLWYCLLGAVQSGVWEAFIIHTYATGRCAYVKDADAFSLSLQGLQTLFFVWLGASWRDVHFYVAHKLIHFNFIYKHVHSLHHRNVVIEPFAGLTMHPVEHLYYFGCAGVGLYLGQSPFIPMWILVHALIAPAASHSGFEDIWQSDQFHNIHHQKFECNYGTAGVPLDRSAGTMREKLGRSELYRGAWNVDDDADDAAHKKTDGAAVAAVPPAKGFLRGGLTLQGALYGSAEQAVHDVVCCVLLPFVVVQAFVDPAGGVLSDLPLPYDLPMRDPTGVFGNEAGVITLTTLHFAAAAVSFGPPLVGLLLCQLGDKRSYRWPFHKV